MQTALAYSQVSCWFNNYQMDHNLRSAVSYFGLFKAFKSDFKYLFSISFVKGT